MKTKIVTGLAAALLVTAGCSLEDIIEDELKANVIYVVNGTAGTIDVSVTGETDRSIASKSLSAQSYVLKDHSDYTVSYDGDHAKSFHYGSVYLYAATTCNTEGYLSDQVNDDRIHVVNMTAETFTENITITDVDGTTYIITDDSAACSVETTNQADGVKIGNGMKFKIGNGDEITVSGIPDALVDKANSIKMDIVIYSTTEGTVVPMAGYDDLL